MLDFYSKLHKMSDTINNFIPSFVQVLTTEGWIDIGAYNGKLKVLLMDHNLKLKYLSPKLISSHNYKGPAIELITESGAIIGKPSTKLLVNKEITKLKEIKKGDKMNRVYLSQTVEHVNYYTWEGKVYSLFFGETLYLPIKYETDYCFAVV